MSSSSQICVRLIHTQRTVSICLTLVSWSARKWWRQKSQDSPQYHTAVDGLLALLPSLGWTLILVDHMANQHARAQSFVFTHFLKPSSETHGDQHMPTYRNISCKPGSQLWHPYSSMYKCLIVVASISHPVAAFESSSFMLPLPKDYGLRSNFNWTMTLQLLC